MSAKARITAWITFMMLFLTGLMLLFVALAGSSERFNDPARRITKVAYDNAEEIEVHDGRLDLSDVENYDDGIYTIYYDENFEVLKGKTYDNVTLSVPFKDQELQKETINGIEYMIYDIYTNNAGHVVMLRSTTSELDNFSIMHTIRILMMVFLPLVLVVAVTGGWLIAWVNLRPVDKITAATSSIADGNDLSRRVYVRHGTKEMLKLTKTINNMIGRLEKSFESEKQFTSDASHELRTPITVITAECSHARKKANTKEDFDKALDVIERNAKRMSDLTESLLHITRLQQGTDKYKKTHANLSEFISVSCDDLATKKDKNIKITTEIEPDIMFNFDLSLMSRLISNLVENAYRYGKENGYIHIVLKKDSGIITLSVKDNGIGISKDNLGNIWNRFWQADSARSGSSGSGLGLSMVKEIVEYHGGNIRVESTEGKGSEFIVTFPEII